LAMGQSPSVTTVTAGNRQWGDHPKVIAPLR
jgi:hypothetical protein